MKKILVPTDFSDQAENALKLAAQFAKKDHLDIVLVHLLELPVQAVDPVMGGHTSDLPEALFFMKLAKKKFAETTSQDYLKGIKVIEKVQFNTAFHGIIEACKEFDCDLIIMGSQGATGFKEMFIGSNTEKVVRNSEVPVLVVKNEHPNFKVENFAFATDFDPEHPKTLQQVIDLAKYFGATLHLVYINTSGKSFSSAEEEDHMNQYMKGLEYDNYTLNIYSDSSVEKGIINFAKNIHADLLGIATHGRKGLSHFFIGSISEDLVNHVNRPIVTFKL